MCLSVSPGLTACPYILGTTDQYLLTNAELSHADREAQSISAMTVTKQKAERPHVA